MPISRQSALDAIGESARELIGALYNTVSAWKTGL